MEAHEIVVTGHTRVLLEEVSASDLEIADLILRKTCTKVLKITLKVLSVFVRKSFV